MFHQERDEPSLWLAKWLLMGQGISLLNIIFSEYKKKLYFARVVSEGGAAGHPGVWNNALHGDVKAEPWQ